LIYLKQIFLQNKLYQQILLKIKEYCGKWQNLTSLKIRPEDVKIAAGEALTV